MGKFNKSEEIRKFLNKKMMESYKEASEKTWPALTFKNAEDFKAKAEELGKTFHGFSIRRSSARPSEAEEEGYKIIYNKIEGERCYIYVRYIDKKRYRSYLNFYHSSSSTYTTTFRSFCAHLGDVYELLEHFEDILKEYVELVEELEKKEKIISIVHGSILALLETTGREIPLSYTTREEDNKIVLSVRLKHNIQMDIPVYYKSFQKRIPKILRTIKLYENVQAESGIEVLISNCSKNTHWKKQE